MSGIELAGLTWPEVEQLLAEDPPPVVFLVLGAVEAHGPHLPLRTDTIIGEHVAQEAAERVQDRGVRGVLAPSFEATAATCAEAFPGTVSVGSKASRQALVETLRAYLGGGVERLCLVTFHFDPAHLSAVRDALGELDEGERSRVAFPDLTDRERAERIGGEFASGDCHAGSFETSLVLAARPEWVGEGRGALEEKRVGLVEGIREGKRSFEALGMPEAYCGDPASASREEGARLSGVLAGLLVEAVVERWGL